MISLILVLLAAPGPAEGTPPAPAADHPRAFVLVAPAPDGAIQTETLAADLTQALRATGVDMVDVATAFPAAPEAAANEGATQTNAGKHAYDNLDLEPAGAAFASALDWYAKHPADATSEQLAELTLLSAAVTLQSGEKTSKKKAQQLFAQALLFDPDLQLDPKYFSGDAKKVLEKAKADVAARPMAPLRVTSSPAAPGMLLSQAITGSADVRQGRHLVRFRLPGHLPAAVLVDVVKGGGDATVTLEPVPRYAQLLKEASALIPSSFAGQALPSSAAQMAATVGARYLVMTEAKTTGGALEVWDTRTGDRLRGVTYTGEPSHAALAQRVKSFIDRPSLVSTTTVGASVERGDGKPLYKQWWLWAAVGGVVVVGATTAGIVAASAPSVPVYNPVLNF